jgi:tetratricopeptide (TPR) repeat protein
MSRPDPDTLAYLEEERDFLLGSLDDLEKEFAAGDVDDADYTELRDDYTKRAADVLRSIETQEAEFDAARRQRSWPRQLAAVAGIVVIALVAGVVLARAVGFRSPSDSATGDIRQSSRTLLLEAQAAAGGGEADAALELYDEVLSNDPSNPEALTYKGWLVWQSGESAAATDLLETAVLVDPSYPDARVFSAVVATREDRLDDAAEHLSVFDTLDPPKVMVDLIESSGIRSEVLAGQIKLDYATATTDEPIQLGGYDVSLDVAAAAGRILDSEGELLLATKMYAAVLADDPDHVPALVARGARLASPEFADFPDIIASGVEMLDRAVELAPENAEARFWRAVALTGLGMAADALLDLEVFERLDQRPQELLDLAAAIDLRGQIEAQL